MENRNEFARNSFELCNTEGTDVVSILSRGTRYHRERSSNTVNTTTEDRRVADEERDRHETAGSAASCKLPSTACDRGTPPKVINPHFFHRLPLYPPHSRARIPTTWRIFHPCVASLAFPSGDDPPHSCQSHSTVIAPVSRTRGTRTSRNPYLHPPSNATRTRCPTPRPPIIEPFTLPHSLTATRAKFSGSEERGDSRFKPIKTMIKAPIGIGYGICSHESSADPIGMEKNKQIF